MTPLTKEQIAELPEHWRKIAAKAARYQGFRDKYPDILSPWPACCPTLLGDALQLAADTRIEARRLAEENAKLRDAERIAWTLAARRSTDGPPFLERIGASYTWVLWTGWGKGDIDLGNERLPVLTDEARAIIDAAMRAESEGRA